MNFQDLIKVECANEYLDRAFRKAKKRIDKQKKDKKADKFQALKTLELARMDSFSQTLESDLNKIIKGFPSLDQLDEFYLELIKCTIDYKLLKKSLGAVNWSIKRIISVTRAYKHKLKRTTSQQFIYKIKKEYLGRSSSFVKQIDEELGFLEGSRKIMKAFPSVKTKIFTICIAGFPNVGKTTLLSKLTSSTPEINSYPFTTKSLNIGYMEHNYRKIQVIDTPGTLDRFDKMNNIEKQANLAIQHLADHVIYVFDPTETYDIQKQRKLYRKIKKFGKPVTLFISKSDLADTGFLREKYPTSFIDVQDLRKEMFKLIQA